MDLGLLIYIPGYLKVRKKEEKKLGKYLHVYM
jgi:hypothetical protein